MRRRDFLAGSTLLALPGGPLAGAPMLWAKPPHGSAAAPVSDAHAHFFNASDLPVRNFLRHVIAAEQFPGLPEIALAIADLAGAMAKQLSLSARTEWQRLGPAAALAGDDDVSAAQFGKAAAQYQQSQINKRSANADAAPQPETNLADSHLALAKLLDVVDMPDAPTADADKSASRAVRIDAERYSALVESAEGDIKRGLESAAVAPVCGIESEIDARTIIRWVFLMCQSRRSHVRKYGAVIRAPGLAVRDAANLLVDYDQWLSETPLPRSSHADQVRFWTRYADVTAANPDAIRLHSFAGYCPLKHVEERLARATETTLDRMKRWVAAGAAGDAGATHRIAGFKIYPPMSFRPDSNAALRLPKDRAAVAIRKRWQRKKWNIDTLGRRLDDALDEFFRFCAEGDVPIIAHAATSNGSMSGAAAMADPAYWVNRAKQVARYGHHPIRVALGHFDMGGLNFATLAAALRLNRDPDVRSNIDFDVSFDTDVLAGNPKCLLDPLAWVCAEVGDGGDYILFGSDWIMLGNQRAAPRYLQTVHDAASAHPFWGDKVDKLFRTNFLRFLKQPV
jgi:hypothetical protein